ncbi:MAG: BACON domain-containing protein [Bacteroidales bacterium]|nr:BACON domain-containing protein [Bacteroidales bacterium]
MKNIFKTFIMLAASIVMAGCLNSIDETGFDPQTPNISFSEENLSIDQNGGELKVMLNSNLPWRVTSDAAWLTVSEENGLEGKELVLTVARNRTRKERLATLTAWIIADQPVKMTVTQDPTPAGESFTYYVKADGDGHAEGFTWETATTLASAMGKAADGDKICVAAGTYTPITLIPGGETEEERTFEIHSNFTIEGGYPADAVTGAVADPANNETILDGAGSAYHVVVVSASKDNTPAVLKNVTITGGRTHTANQQTYRQAGENLVDVGLAGGIYIGKANFVMENCKVIANAAALAAGCYISPNAEVTFRQCVFQNNSADSNGGGIWNAGGTLYMYDSVVAQNTCGQQAAGYYSIDSGGTITVSRIYNTLFLENDCTQKNEKRSGGALYIRAGSDAVFVNCTITGNKAGWGAAISGHGTGQEAAKLSNTTFFNCTITGNHANNGGGGLFAYNAGAQITAYNCIVSGNTSSGIAAESGVLDGVDANRVLVKNSVLGSSLVDAAGGAVGGWGFSTSMIGELGYYDNSITKCFPLVVSADNPAVDQGLSNADLQELAGGFNPAVDMELLLSGQNAVQRTKKSIGSYNAK